MRISEASATSHMKSPNAPANSVSEHAINTIADARELIRVMPDMPSSPFI